MAKKNTPKQRKKNKGKLDNSAKGKTPPSNRPEQIKLIFPPAPGAIHGFTNAASSQFAKEATSCVRELIQNSLDAVIDVEEDVARVHFSIEEHSLSDIPGMEEHRQALDFAMDKESNRQTENVSESIKEYSQKDTVSVLFVADNGIGLNKERLGAMLADGVSSKKSEDASGSFGNGHLTSFALSNLHYVLYGGVTEGKMYFTGHATLASHFGKNEKGEQENLSKDGFYVKKINNRKSGSEHFEFGEENDLPKILRPHMESIKKKWKHGALIAILSFNHFGNKTQDKNSDTILRETALNFFPAINKEQLEIEISDNQKIDTLDKIKLQSIIEREQDKKRGKGDFPSGNRTWNAFQTLINGKEHIVTTSFGDIKMYLREGGDNQRVSLCRNGMWISDNVTKLRARDFSNKINFNALLLVESQYSGEAHTLLKMAESPLHNKIDPKSINNPQKRQSLYSLLGEIQTGIKEHVEEKNEDSFSPSDFFPIEASDSITGKKDVPGGQIRKFPEGKKPPKKGEGKGGKKKIKQKSFYPDNRIAVKISSRRIAPEKLSILLQAKEDCTNAEIGLSLDEGKDLTCVSSAQSIIYIKDITVKDVPSQQLEKLKDETGNIYAVRLGEWKQDTDYHLEITYEKPQSTTTDYALIVNLAHGKSNNNLTNTQEKTNE